MKKIMIISALILTAATTALSQTSSDALRYSRIDIGGTARYMGLSGAFGALGADFTLSSTNPAGLGLFKSSEFTNTPAVHIGNVQSLSNDFSGSDSRTNFYLGNIGIVLTSKVKSNPNKPGWRYVTFATGLNRLNDFNRRYEMGDLNTTNSLLDVYVNDAYGTDYTEFESDPPYGAYDLSLAWYDYLLDTISPNQYISPVTPGRSKYQYKSIDSWGSMNEYVFSFATNYNDRLYLGMTFGIPMIRYFEQSVYSESDIKKSNLIYFDRIENLETRGSGFNMKLGFVYRVSDWFRFGAAFHSPSWFANMKDYWDATMIAEYYEPPNPGDPQKNFLTSSPRGYYEYELTTPWRIQGNLAFIIGNIGLVSADYEMADYSKASLDAYDYNFRDENSAIDNSYAISHNIRVGTEWRYNIYSFRAGGKYFTSPYQDNINDGSGFGFSGGVGLKQKWFFMDLAYAYSNMKDDYYFYNTPGISANPIENSTRNHSILLTLGAKL
jgi:hypothetical protein